MEQYLVLLVGAGGWNHSRATRGHHPVDFYGFVLPFVNKLMGLSKQANMPVKIRACDTMDWG